MKTNLLTALFVGLGSIAQAQTWPQTSTLLRDIAPGQTDGVTGSLAAIPVSGKLVFAADSQNISQKLWMSDGTTAGTTRVSGPDYQGNFGPYISFLTWKGKSYHTAAGGPSASTGGSVLWRTGTSGSGSDSLSVFSPYPGAGVPPYDTTSTWLYFFNMAGGSSYGSIMKTDGTRAGTSLVPTVNGYVQADKIAAIGDEVYYYALVSGASGLYKTNALTGVHTALKTGNPVILGRAGSSVYFTLPAASSTYDLWASDGTVTGTVLLKAGFKSKPVAFREWKGKAYFGGVQNAYEQNLWTSDGTPAGTKVVFSLPAAASVSGSLSPVSGREFVDMGSFLMFVGLDTAGNEPWRTDGTPAGTYRIKDLLPPNISYNGGSVFEATFSQRNVIDGRIYFRAFSDTAAYQVHVSDGTAAGTVRATYLQPKGQNGMGNGDVAKYGNRIYFVGETVATGREVYSFPAPAPVSQSVSGTFSAPTALHIYPNPAGQAITIAGSVVGDRAIIRDLTGRICKDQLLDGPELSVRGLPAGNYLISILRNDKTTGTAVFVKE